MLTQIKFTLEREKIRLWSMHIYNIWIFKMISDNGLKSLLYHYPEFKWEEKDYDGEMFSIGRLRGRCGFKYFSESIEEIRYNLEDIFPKSEIEELSHRFSIATEGLDLKGRLSLSIGLGVLTPEEMELMRVEMESRREKYPLDLLQGNNIERVDGKYYSNYKLRADFFKTEDIPKFIQLVQIIQTIPSSSPILSRWRSRIMQPEEGVVVEEMLGLFESDHYKEMEKRAQEGSRSSLVWGLYEKELLEFAEEKLSEAMTLEKEERNRQIAQLLNVVNFADRNESKEESIYAIVKERVSSYLSIPLNQIYRFSVDRFKDNPEIKFINKGGVKERSKQYWSLVRLGSVREYWFKSCNG